MKPSCFRDVTRHSLTAVCDISDQTIGSTLNNQSFQLEYKEEVDTVLYRGRIGRFLALRVCKGASQVTGL